MVCFRRTQVPFFFPEGRDNGAGLASFHREPPLAASTANVCPQSHVGAQTREPFEPRRPCKQSGPLGMHVRIHRRALCRRWHLFSWLVGASGRAGGRVAGSFVSGVVVRQGPRAERTHEHQQHPASFIRDAFPQRGGIVP